MWFFDLLACAFAVASRAVYEVLKRAEPLMGPSRRDLAELAIAYGTGGAAASIWRDTVAQTGVDAFNVTRDGRLVVTDD